MSPSKPSKAALRDDVGTLACQYNPETVKRTKTASYSDVAAKGADRQPSQQFTGTGPETLSVTLLFDAFDPTTRGPGSGVDAVINRAFGWLQVAPARRDSTDPQPADITFLWGAGLAFTGKAQSVEADYLMFDTDGRTLRATVALSLQASPQDPPAQNPTSGGRSGAAEAALGAGDTLASIAYAHYGDPTLWRGVARANGVSDPSRVPLGTRLLLPDRTTVAALTRGRRP